MKYLIKFWIFIILIFFNASTSFLEYEIEKANNENYEMNTIMYDELYYHWEDTQMFTLNGFMFSIIGLYDYWYTFGSDNVEGLLSYSLTTLKEYVLKFRFEDGISYYDLKYKVQSDRYHKHHIEELRYMSLISNDNYFDNIADIFLNDYDPY